MAQTIRILLDKISIPELDTVADLVLAFNGNMDKIDATSSNNCFTGSRAPIASDDINASYAAGSLWFDTTNDKFYVCLDASAGAAIWREVYVKAGSNWLIDHGSQVTGLLDDDHTIYLLVNGSRALTGDLNLNSHRILNLPDPVAPADPLRWQDRWYGVYDNALINSSFLINSYGLAEYNSISLPANNNGQYIHDQWILQSDGNNVVKVIPQGRLIQDVATGWECKLQVVTANKKFGYMQPLELSTVQTLQLRHVSLSTLVYTPSTNPVRNVRLGIIKWIAAGSPDTVTRGVVSSWGAQGSNPTLVANWAFVAASSSVALTADQYTPVKLENVLVPGDAVNLGFFLWVDDTDCAINDYITFTSCKLGVGSEAFQYSPLSYSEEQYKCGRYFQKFDSLNAPYTGFGDGVPSAATNAVIIMPLGSPLLKTPTLSYSGNMVVWQTSGSQAVTSIGLNSMNRNAIGVNAGCAGGLDIARPAVLYSSNDTTVKFYVDSRI